MREEEAATSRFSLLVWCECEEEEGEVPLLGVVLSQVVWSSTMVAVPAVSSGVSESMSSGALKYMPGKNHTIGCIQNNMLRALPSQKE